MSKQPPKLSGVQHDALKPGADPKKAAEKYARRMYGPAFLDDSLNAPITMSDFLAGVAWEKRRRRREGA